MNFVIPFRTADRLWCLWHLTGLRPVRLRNFGTILPWWRFLYHSLIPRCRSPFMAATWNFLIPLSCRSRSFPWTLILLWPILLTLISMAQSLPINLNKSVFLDVIISFLPLLSLDILIHLGSLLFLLFLSIFSLLLRQFGFGWGFGDVGVGSSRWRVLSYGWLVEIGGLLLGS